MIFSHALRRELGYTTSAVFLVMLTIMLTTLIVRTLDQAASGRVDKTDVLILIGLGTLGYLAILLAVSTFVAILIVLTRWYRDAEMVIWFSSGLGLLHFIRPVFYFVLPIVLVITLLALIVWPWSNQQVDILKQRFGKRDDISFVTAGQFYESAYANRIFFVEGLSPESDYIKNIFITDSREGKVGIAVAQKGYLKTTASGDRYITLDYGRRYEGVPGHLDFKIVEFEHYTAKLPVQTRHTLLNASLPKMLDTPELIAHPTAENLAELLWRIGLPLLALVLAMLAIPLAYVNPRRGRYHTLAAALLIYLIYSSLLNLSQAWVTQSKLSFAAGWWPVHLGFFILCIFLLWLRHTNTALSHRLLGRILDKLTHRT